MKPTAEAIGLTTDNTVEEGCYWEGKNPSSLIRWNPTEDAEQCIKLLEWLKNQKLKIKIFWDWHIELWDIDAYNIIDDLRIEHKDFKTAVFLAAVEYIKNKK